MSGGFEIDAPAGAARQERMEDKPTLRFLTCGSVDDGKSTLIGRLLFEQDLVPDDVLAALRRDTVLHGTTGEALDFALLVDGLEAERQQGITIDVAYRYVRTKRRSFIIADTPGHEQYTRNMVTGASNSELAILLVDARKGLLAQTKRHAAIASLLGIRHVVLAVNKIDLVGYDEAVFAAITAAFRRFAVPLDFTDVTAIPLSARHGDNLSTVSPNMPWYDGPALLDHLEGIDVSDERAGGDFRLPVQWINRPDLDFRGLAGTLASGRIAVGDAIVVAGSGRGTSVRRILVAGAEATQAVAGDAVTLVLTQEIDAARGDVLASPTARPSVADGFDATLVWMDEEPLRLRQSYLLKLATRTVPASVSALAHRLDIDRYAPEPAATLSLNEVGRVTIRAAAPLAFDPYAANPVTGAFILIDRDTNRTVATGTVLAGARLGERRGSAVPPGPAERASMKNQRAGVVWLTGPAAEAVAPAVDARLHGRGLHTALLREADLAGGLNRGLGDRDPAERAEAVRRMAELARVLRDAGLVAVCAVERDEPEAMRPVLAGEALHEIAVAADASVDGEAERVVDVLAERLVAPADLSDWSI